MFEVFPSMEGGIVGVETRTVYMLLFNRKRLKFMKQVNVCLDEKECVCIFLSL